ncbi:hypothetical protein [Rhizobium lusitanum]|uniref:Uncharacterized protein n=1 Tax=Rhizobium lusitanum TaxID=293958 RepID=A0A7X0IQX8_9HYPH|nr:hypothetical protein [Rhizobium lusitanum]MBB6484051.1 hypothetical protein [Rhizobium lusitanum]
MHKLLITSVFLLVAPSLGQTSPLKDEFAASLEMVVPALSDRAHLTIGEADKVDSNRNDRLLDQIQGTWTILDMISLDNEDAIAKSCVNVPVRFQKINDYTASKSITLGKATYEFKYIFRKGISYHIRTDIDALIANNHQKDNLPSKELDIFDRQYLETANRVANLLLVSPNVLLEVIDGNERLYGRCE